MFHVVLYEPEIPPNTGNIIRLCANAGVALHLIKPLGFDWDDVRLKRAGLDYHEFASVVLYDSFNAFLLKVQPKRVFACSTRGRQNYAAIAFHPQDAFVFGPETRGLPQNMLDALPAERRLRIPMRANNRSLNLSNAVAIIVYEALRQHDFQDMDI